MHAVSLSLSSFIPVHLVHPNLILFTCFRYLRLTLCSALNDASSNFGGGVEAGKKNTTRYSFVSNVQALNLCKRKLLFWDKNETKIKSGQEDRVERQAIHLLSVCVCVSLA